MLSSTSDADKLKNLWLLCKAAQVPFRKGFLQIRPNYSFEWEEGQDEDDPNATQALVHFLFITHLFNSNPCLQYKTTTMYPETIDSWHFPDGEYFDATYFHKFKLKTPDPAAMPLASAFLLRTQFRFTAPLHSFHVEARILEGWGKPLKCKNRYLLDLNG
jgi:hypothetical protein